MKLVSKEIFAKSPQPGAAAMGYSFYSRSKGVEMIRVLGSMTRADTMDTEIRSYSSDNGKTWSEPEIQEFIFETDAGVHRQYIRPGFVDPVNGWMLTMVVEGVLPNDDPMDGERNWYLRYRVSKDGGRTTIVDEVLVQKGDYTTEHPIEGVWVGKNGIMIGDVSARPIRTSGGKVLVPANITPIGPSGQYHNPGDGYSYYEALVLVGTWFDCGRMEWDVSEMVKNDPKQSTRGSIEPTLAEFPDGRILMVLRGCNAKYNAEDDSEYYAKDENGNDLEGHEWFSVSKDGGYTWSKPAEWKYSNGQSFYAPGACSQLLSHSNGHIYWMGNITPENPLGGAPRYPFVIGRVDPKTLGLVKETVTILDDRDNDESEMLSLSNFFAEEDRETGEVMIYMPRLGEKRYKDTPVDEIDWTANVYLYRVEL